MAAAPHLQRSCFRPALLVLAALFAFGACAHLDGLVAGQAKPEVRVQNVSLAEADLRRIALQVGFEVQNPYGVSLPVLGLRYRVWIADVPLAEGEVQLERPIPARGSAPLTTTLAFGPVDAARAAGRLALGNRRYRIEGTLTVRTPMGPLGVTLRHQGKLSGAGVPKLGLGGLLGR